MSVKIYIESLIYSDRHPPAPCRVRRAGKEATKDVFMCGAPLVDPGNTPLMDNLGKRIIAKYGKNESIYLQGANAFWLLVQAIQAAQSFDPTVVKGPSRY